MPFYIYISSHLLLAFAAFLLSFSFSLFFFLLFFLLLLSFSLVATTAMVGRLLRLWSVVGTNRKKGAGAHDDK